MRNVMALPGAVAFKSKNVIVGALGVGGAPVETRTKSVRKLGGENRRPTSTVKLTDRGSLFQTRNGVGACWAILFKSLQNNFARLCYSASVAGFSLRAKLEDLVVVLGESNGRERSFRRVLQVLGSPRRELDAL